MLKKKAKKQRRAAVRNALKGIRPKTRYKDNIRD
jgi:hypothetical protein